MTDLEEYLVAVRGGKKKEKKKKKSAKKKLKRGKGLKNKSREKKTSVIKPPLKLLKGRGIRKTKKK